MESVLDVEGVPDVEMTGAVRHAIGVDEYDEDTDATSDWEDDPGGKFRARSFSVYLVVSRGSLCLCLCLSGFPPFLYLAFYFCF